MTSAILRLQLENTLAQRIPAAFSKKVCRAPEKLPSRIADVDALLAGGVPRGGFTEITGPVSTGRTSLALSILAGATRTHACAWQNQDNVISVKAALVKPLAINDATSPRSHDFH